MERPSKLPPTATHSRTPNLAPHWLIAYPKPSLTIADAAASQLRDSRARAKIGVLRDAPPRKKFHKSQKIFSSVRAI
jgi:hypothetical protein